MLLGTTLGWFLIQKAANVPFWTISTHEKQNLIELQMKARCHEQEVSESPSARYRFCMFLDGPALCRVMAAFAERIPYTDFLQAIAETPGQSMKLELYRELDDIMKPIVEREAPVLRDYRPEQDPSLDHYSAPHAMGELKKQQKEQDESRRTS